MNSDDLTLFATVARAGSISRAAIEIGIDQSTISRRIALLEAEAGVRLFHRSGRGVVPTDRGRELLGFAATVTRTLGDALRAMRDRSDQGPTRCGFSPRIVLECDGSISITKRLVMENCGCTVLPLAAVSEDVTAGRLKSYPLANPEVRRSVALVLGKTQVELASLWETKRIIKERVADLVRSGAWPDTLLDPALADVDLAAAGGRVRHDGGVSSP